MLEGVAGVLLFLGAGAFLVIVCYLNYDYSQTFFSEFVRSRCLFLYPTTLLYLNIQDPQRAILIFELIKKRAWPIILRHLKWCTFWSDYVQVAKS